MRALAGLGSPVPTRVPSGRTRVVVLEEDAVAIATAIEGTTRAVAADLELFRGVLERQRAECLRQRELALAESTTSVPDAVAVSRAASLGRTLEEIEAALARIAAGSYGTCTRCGEGVPLPRLEARPFASSCVACAGSQQ
jgi:RNA polymerase-binding transcription factor DksA